MKSTALKLFTAMTILLAQLSNDVRQDAAGSSRPVQLGELRVFIDMAKTIDDFMF